MSHTGEAKRERPWDDTASASPKLVTSPGTAQHIGRTRTLREECRWCHSRPCWTFGAQYGCVILGLLHALSERIEALSRSAAKVLALLVETVLSMLQSATGKRPRQRSVCSVPQRIE